MELFSDNRSDYSNQFEALLQSDPYSSVDNILYKFRVKNPIPRTRGENDILYIGRTKLSLSGRYYPSRAFNIEMDYFDNFYKQAMEIYGPIRIEIKAVEDTKYCEWKALSDYFERHLEYPPLNRSIPSKPT